MVLTVIAIVIAVAAIAAAVIAFVRTARLSAEQERLGWEVKGLETSVKILQKAVEEKDKEIPVAGIEGLSYDPETATMTVDGNLAVNGQIVGKKGITTKK